MLDLIVGQVTPPPAIGAYVRSSLCVSGAAACGLVTFISNLVKFIVIVAGLYALINLILAGFAFMSAGGDPKAVEKAWGKIWQSIVGLAVVVASFVLIAVISWILFKDPTAILFPKIYGPNL